MNLIGKNISYKYPSGKEYILKDVNIEIDSEKYPKRC